MAAAEPPQLPYARDPNSYSAHYQNSAHTNAYAYANSTNGGGGGGYGQGSMHGHNASHAQHQMQQYHQQQAYAQQHQQYQQQQHGQQPGHGQYEAYQHGANGYHMGPDGEMYENLDDMALQEEAVEEEGDGAALQYWTAPRHRVGARDKGKDREEEYLPWRLKSRSKTMNAGMFICLNIGVDPPDIVKTNPCAKMETWIDPGSMPSTKAIEQIGRNLHQQFETLNPKVKFKSCLDPTFEDTKKQCIALRKAARDERTVFYYNGHGVPKPTSSGEIWVFNKTYTQYIPVSLQDLQDWLGSPTVYVWECSGAGNILTNFIRAAEKRDAEARQAAAAAGQPEPASLFADAIHLAACTAAQVLPMSPDLPADLFTCCLTSPIETSLRHFVLQDPLRRNISTSPDDPRSKVTVEMVMRIPGDLKDRRTPLGELNWIFTAVTDTIAWSSFPRDIFNRLFRQDLLVAALFRNFLLAQRIMTTYHCTPMSIPELPMTSNHPLWHSWDLAVDACLSQLPELLEAQEAHDNGTSHVPPLSTYRPSTFFAQHLQAFEVWLQHGGTASSTSLKGGAEAASIVAHRPPPEQLPIVLQVLLSQAHRLRALILLSRFVDLGPWAVHLSLSIGIFPYVQKLLQSPAIELKPVLIFIWARILAVDKSCQVDLLRDQGYEYFAKILSPYGMAANSNQPLSIPNANEHRAMCAFILSTLCRNFRSGQNACLASEVFDACMVRLGEDDWLLKTWSLLCIAQLWADNDDAKALFHSPQRQAELLGALRSTAVEVRAAALYAFGTYLGASAAGASTTDNPGGGGTGAQIGIDEATQLETEAGLAFACLMSVKEDASPMVRKELVVVISCVVREWRGWMVCAAWAYYEQEAALARAEKAADEQEKERVRGRASTGRSAFERVPGMSTPEAAGAGANTPTTGGSEDVMQKALERWATQDPATDRHNNLTLLSSFKVVFETLLDLSVDPSTEVALMASTVIDYIVALLLDSAFMRVQGAAIQHLPKRKHGHGLPQLSTRQPSVLAERMGQAQAQAEAQAHASGQGKPSLDRRHTAGMPALSRNDSGLDGAGSGSSSGAATGLGGSFANLTRNSSVANALKNLASMTGLIASDTGKEDGEARKEDPTTDVTPSSTTPGAGYTSPYPGADHPRTLPAERPLQQHQQQQQQQQQQYPAQSHTSHLQNSHHSSHSAGTGGLARSGAYANLQYPAEPVDAADVLATMTEEDMERLRIRRIKGTQAGGDANGHLANNGLPRQGDLGLGMVAKEVRDDVLPLRSGFYDWAVEYFKAPQMKAPDADEPGSMTYNAQAWRSIRNEQLVETSRINEDYASHHAWDTEAGTLHNDAWPLQLGFHSFDPVMAVTDDTDKICLWDWKACRKLNKFSNQNVPGSCISSMHFINEMASSLLMTASTEGSVRIWRDYENPGETELASTFRVVSDLYPVAHSSGVLTAWEQSKGHLLVGGDMKVVRLWDATVERHLRDIATQAGSNLTSLASDEPEGNVFVAGFGDGVVRLFDKRAADAGAVVMRTWRKHHTWIQSVHLQRGGQRELVTGSMNGEVRIWDSRAPDKPLYEDIPQPQGLMALAVHPGAPVFASTSAPTGHSTRQRLVIQGFSQPARPRMLSNIAIPLVPTYHVPSRPFLPSASSLVFHPVEMVVAAGGFDSSGQVKLYRCPLPETKRHYEDIPLINGH